MLERIYQRLTILRSPISETIETFRMESNAAFTTSSIMGAFIAYLAQKETPLGEYLICHPALALVPVPTDLLHQSTSKSPMDSDHCQTGYPIILSYLKV